jgi:hypothetical protein
LTTTARRRIGISKVNQILENFHRNLRNNYRKSRIKIKALKSTKRTQVVVGQDLILPIQRETITSALVELSRRLRETGHAPILNVIKLL